MRPIDADKTIGLLKTRLYETALNNATVNCDASYLYTECADNRIETWIDEIPTIEPKTAEFIRGDCRSYYQVICSNCGHEAIEKEEDAFYWLTPYCPYCGAKIIRINLKRRDE